MGHMRSAGIGADRPQPQLEAHGAATWSGHADQLLLPAAKPPNRAKANGGLNLQGGTIDPGTATSHGKTK